MSKFQPKLARINNRCCEQVMPAPVIPVCAVSCSIPVPIVRVNDTILPSTITFIPTSQIPNQANTGCAPCAPCQR